MKLTFTKPQDAKHFWKRIETGVIIVQGFRWAFLCSGQIVFLNRMYWGGYTDRLDLDLLFVTNANANPYTTNRKTK